MVSTFAGNNDGFLDGPADLAQFRFPTGIAIGAQRNIYVGEYENHKVRKIAPNKEVTTLAGSTKGNEDGPGTTAKFEFPYGITIDSKGDLYVTDRRNHNIRANPVDIGIRLLRQRRPSRNAGTTR